MLADLVRMANALRGLLGRPSAAHRAVPIPVLRNLVSDILAEGRRKSLIHLPFEAELGPHAPLGGNRPAGDGERVSLTAWVAAAFARVLDAEKAMQGYVGSRRRLVVFEEVDITFMVEQNVDGRPLPVPLTVRAANRKTPAAISAELAAGRGARPGKLGSLTELEIRFFSLPQGFRRCVWFLIRRRPALFKQLLGTVAVTSSGMFASGSAVVIPISPMTLTLSIGALGRRLRRRDGQIEEYVTLALNLSADHEVVDGAPLMRFCEKLRQALAEDSGQTNIAISSRDENGT